MLWELYANATKYHNLGGNLKAIELFLNDNIDPTIQMYHENFTFDNGMTITDNLTSNIVQELKDLDSSRGGYGNG